MVYEISPIARIRTDFPQKFGLPRQSGLIESLIGKILFEPEFRNIDAVRGLDQYSHIWVIWQFSDVNQKQWSPTVRPPRLGGNKRVGVFATRSPFRPNHMGLSLLKLDSITLDKRYGPVLNVSGIDMTDNTPIFDIKPYLSYTDSRKEVKDGFAGDVLYKKIDVVIPQIFRGKISEDIIDTIKSIIEQDPRPHYQNDSERVYGFSFSEYEVKFVVKDNIASVIDIK